jgi:hypothetical protein
VNSPNFLGFEVSAEAQKESPPKAGSRLIGYPDLSVDLGKPSGGF